jgi:hypothetical protein
MLSILFFVAAAQSAALIPDSPPATTAPSAAAQAAAKPAKPRRKKCAYDDAADTGSHISMGTCRTAQQEEDAAAKGIRDYHAYVTEHRGDAGVPH